MSKKESIDESIVESTSNASLVVAPNESDLEILRSQGGADLAGNFVTFPNLRVEHTTNFEGDPNPNKGQFSVSVQNELGEWEETLLGKKITIQVILQRHRLEMVKRGEGKFTTPEFDEPGAVVPLFVRSENGDGVKVFAEGSIDELTKKFLKKNDKGRVFSELRNLYVLYVRVNGEIVKWKQNLSATIAWSKFCKKIMNNQFAYEIDVELIEEKNGTVKYYVPAFTAANRITDIKSVIADQKTLRSELNPVAESITDLAEEITY